MGKVKVLIVEDESIVAIDLRTRLEAHGYEVIKHVLTGRDAIKYAVELNPDIILMDIHLKDDIDGIEAANSIREQIQVPIIFLTAYADNDTLERAKLSEVFGYIIKPYQERELFVNIEIALFKYEMEEKLRHSQNRLETTLQSIADAVITTDEKGKIDFVNNAAGNLLKLVPEKIIGLKISDFFPDFGKRSKQIEKEINGKQFTLEITDSRIHDNKGNVTGDVYILRDISIRTEYEKTLRKAKKDAEEASIMKSDFLANMSHELRTPLNSILGLTELSLETDDDNERGEYLTIVKQAGESLLNLINSILDFSKIEAGKMKKEEIPFDLLQVLEDTIERMYIQAHKKNIHLSLNMNENCPAALLGDSHKLFQILINLLGNSIKFTEGGYIHLEAEKLDSSGNTTIVQFKVTDTGKGIPSEKIELIFNSFTQVDSSSTRIHGGTGLGLAIVKKLVELLDGEIYVKSEIGMGSEFTFSIPFIEDNSREDSYGLKHFDQLTANLFFNDPYDAGRISRLLMRLGINSRIITGKELNHLSHSEKNNIYICDNINMQMEIDRKSEIFRKIGKDLIIFCEMGEQSFWKDKGIENILINPVKLISIQNQLLSYLDYIGTAVKKGKSGKTIKPGENSFNILLLEDEKNNRLIAERILKHRGHTVTSFENGRMGLEALKKETYDLVLVDIQMPDLDGIEFARIVRKNLEPVLNPDIPIIAVTAHAIGGYREKCMNEGMNAFITKPYTVHGFLEVIESTMGAKTPLEKGKSRKEYYDTLRGSINSMDYATIENICQEWRENNSMNEELSENLFRLVLAARRKNSGKIEQIWRHILEFSRLKGGIK